MPANGPVFNRARSGARRLCMPLIVLVATVMIGGGAITNASAADAVRGVTDTEIVIGSITDLSGVTAIQAVNNIDAVRLVFDEANANGGVHGRKIHLIVEDTQYQVPRAVQGMNKLLNRDNIFFTLVDGGTPMNNAVMPMQFEKNVPNLFPLTAARSMYEPFNRLKFGQFASYYDQMRAGVKYFINDRGKKTICAMYQDSDFGRDVMAGAVDQLKAMNVALVAETAHKPTDTDFNGPIAKLHDANCDLILLGTIVRDTTIILATVKKIGWNVDLMGQSASYDTSVASAPGGVGEGFYSMTPGIYAYPDDPRPAVREFAQKYKAATGRDPNFLGETGWTTGHVVLLALDRAGRDLTLDSLIKGVESIKDYHDIFGGPPLSFGPDQHHGSSASFLAVVHDGRWVPAIDNPIGY
jgi:branched-chain amino acid transport system substrate-binding protein